MLILLVSRFTFHVILYLSFSAIAIGFFYYESWNFGLVRLDSRLSSLFIKGRKTLYWTNIAKRQWVVSLGVVLVVCVAAVAGASFYLEVVVHHGLLHLGPLARTPDVFGHVLHEVEAAVEGAVEGAVWAGVGLTQDASRKAINKKWGLPDYQLTFCAQLFGNFQIQFFQVSLVWFEFDLSFW
jgi:hypothetical protein